MRKRKPNAVKGGWHSSDMERTVEYVLKNNISERTAARNCELGIDKMYGNCVPNCFIVFKI